MDSETGLTYLVTEIPAPRVKSSKFCTSEDDVVRRYFGFPTVTEIFDFDDIYTDASVYPFPLLLCSERGCTVWIGWMRGGCHTGNGKMGQRGGTDQGGPWFHFRCNIHPIHTVSFTVSLFNSYNFFF